MSFRGYIRASTAGLLAGGALIAASYASFVAISWIGFGRAKRPHRQDERDPLLDRFMPRYDVVERHSIRIGAPAGITLAAACDQDLRSSALIDAIFKAREAIMGSKPAAPVREGGLLAQMKALGWRLLAEAPNREVVMGAVCQPWMADVVFHGLAPDEFTAFREPGYVKIAWTLRADPLGEGETLFRTETRAVATDAAARAKFRWYWAKISPGVRLIRRLLLGPLKREAERRRALPATPAWQANDPRKTV